MNKENLIKTFEQTRTYFPALTDIQKDEAVYYLDNSAGTQVSQFVMTAMNNFFVKRNAQKGDLFLREGWMSNTIIEARQAAADLVGAQDHTEIALGLNASSFFQVFAHHLSRDLKTGDHIIVSEIGHWSNIDPWRELEERGIHVHNWHGDESGHFDWAHLDELLRLSPKIVAMGWVSNATGTISDIKAAAAKAHKVGALVVVDAVQQVPHLPTDFQEADVDFAAFSGYKVFGPHLGFGYFNRQKPDRLTGYKIKDMLTNDAKAFEVGTQNHEGIIGFLGAIAYLKQVCSTGINNNLVMPDNHLPYDVNEQRQTLYHAMYLIKHYEQLLSAYFFDKLRLINGVELYGKPNSEPLDERVPVFAFNIEGWTAKDIGIALNEYGIEARTGDFHNNDVKKLANRFDGAAVRISMIHYNTFADIDYLFQCLEQMTGFNN